MLSFAISFLTTDEHRWTQIFYLLFNTENVQPIIFLKSICIHMYSSVVSSHTTINSIKINPSDFLSIVFTIIIKLNFQGFLDSWTSTGSNTMELILTLFKFLLRIFYVLYKIPLYSCYLIFTSFFILLIL